MNKKSVVVYSIIAATLVLLIFLLIADFDSPRSEKDNTEVPNAANGTEKTVAPKTIRKRQSGRFLKKKREEPSRSLWAIDLHPDKWKDEELLSTIEEMLFCDQMEIDRYLWLRKGILAKIYSENNVSTALLYTLLMDSGKSKGIKPLKGRPPKYPPLSLRNIDGAYMLLMSTDRPTNIVASMAKKYQSIEIQSSAHKALQKRLKGWPADSKKVYAVYNQLVSVKDLTTLSKMMEKILKTGSLSGRIALIKALKEWVLNPSGKPSTAYMLMFKYCTHKYMAVVILDLIAYLKNSKGIEIRRENRLSALASDLDTVLSMSKRSGNFQTKKIIRTLLSLYFDSTDPEYSSYIIALALGGCNDGDLQAINLLSQMLRDSSDYRIRGSALISLGRLASFKTIQAFHPFKFIPSPKREEEILEQTCIISCFTHLSNTHPEDLPLIRPFIEKGLREWVLNNKSRQSGTFLLETLSEYLRVPGIEPLLKKIIEKSSNKEYVSLAKEALKFQKRGGR